MAVALPTPVPPPVMIAALPTVGSVFMAEEYAEATPGGKDNPEAAAIPIDNPAAGR